MWKRIRTVLFTAVLLFTSWAAGKWLVEPASSCPRYDLTLGALWSESPSERKTQIELAKTKLSAALDRVKRKINELSPKLNERLRPPATDREIDQLEKAIGRQLPAEYRAFLELHNGTSGGYVVAQFHSVEKVLEKYHHNLQYLLFYENQTLEGYETDGTESPRYLEIADTGVGIEIRLDLVTGTTWLFQSSNGASKHWDSMTHVFESILKWDIETLDDGDRWLPDFEASL